MLATRRELLCGTVGAIATLGFVGEPTYSNAIAPTTATPTDALARLVVGNHRYASAHQTHPDQSMRRRHQLATAQHPFAMVLGCVDSRVPPEIIFDQGLGDLLTVRTAGEVLDSAVIGSLAYGVEELHIPLLVVLGHQRCGAVGAAVEFARTHNPLSPHVMRIVNEIEPAVSIATLGGADCVEQAVAANVHRVCDQLAADAELAPVVRANQLRIVGARFVLDTGKVEFYL